MSTHIEDLQDQRSETTEENQGESNEGSGDESSGTEQAAADAVEQAQATDEMPDNLFGSGGPEIKAPDVKGIGEIIPMYFEERYTHVDDEGRLVSGAQALRVNGLVWKMLITRGTSASAKNALKQAHANFENEGASQRLGKVKVNGEGKVEASERTPGSINEGARMTSLLNVYGDSYSPYQNQHTCIPVWDDEGQLKLTRVGRTLVDQLANINNRYRACCLAESGQELGGYARFYEEGYTSEAVIDGYKNVVRSILMSWREDFSVNTEGSFPQLEAETPEGEHFLAALNRSEETEEPESDEEEVPEGDNFFEGL